MSRHYIEVLADSNDLHKCEAEIAYWKQAHYVKDLAQHMIMMWEEVALTRVLRRSL